VQVFEGRLVEGDAKGGGQILQASSGTGASKQTFNYSTDRIVGNGSFGVVFQATCLETGETVGCRERAQGVCAHDSALCLTKGTELCILNPSSGLHSDF
jgi:hypothetical protein